MCVRSANLCPSSALVVCTFCALNEIDCDPRRAVGGNWLSTSDAARFD